MLFQIKEAERNENIVAIEEKRKKKKNDRVMHYSTHNSILLIQTAKNTFKSYKINASE